MKTLFLRSYYYALAAFLCAGSVCLAADSVVSEATPANTVVPAAPTTSTAAPEMVAPVVSANTDSAVSSAQSTAVVSAPSVAAVPAPSVEELQKRNAERAAALAERHNKTKALLAELQAKAAPIIKGLKDAKESVEKQSAAAAQIAALAPAASPSPATAPVVPVVPSAEAPK